MRDLGVEGDLRLEPLVAVDLLFVEARENRLHHGLEAGGVVVHGRQQLPGLDGGLGRCRLAPLLDRTPPGILRDLAGASHTRGGGCYRSKSGGSSEKKFGAGSEALITNCNAPICVAGDQSRQRGIWGRGMR